MVRCPRCNHLNKWTPVPIETCHFCGMFVIMPSERDAMNSGVLDGVDQPYVWILRSDEVVLFMDGLEGLMNFFQTMLQGENDDVIVGALSGSYLFAKMTWDKFKKLSPGLELERKGPIV